MFAALNGHEAMVRLLLTAGADKDLQSIVSVYMTLRACAIIGLFLPLLCCLCQVLQCTLYMIKAFYLNVCFLFLL
jgi:hypothetical protein